MMNFNCRGGYDPYKEDPYRRGPPASDPYDRYAR